MLACWGGLGSGRAFEAAVERRHQWVTRRMVGSPWGPDHPDQQAKARQKRKPANSVVENLPQQNADSGKARDQVGKGAWPTSAQDASTPS